MVAYTTALGDLEMGGQQKTVVFLEKKSSSRRIWKVSGALLLVALGLAGILCFALYWNGRPAVVVRVCVCVKPVRDPSVFVWSLTIATVWSTQKESGGKEEAAARTQERTGEFQQLQEFRWTR